MNNLHEKIDILIADSDDEKALTEICNNTRSIATTVGPYRFSGTMLVNLCAAFGTDYCDITGEVDWMDYCKEQFDHIAQESGARIVHFCGCDSIPWDIST